ncbi:hypothetical protein MF271_11260 [Deinococcus sp. KNUC1210]|uniref:hypothetical protein n=1 Tax=Deinococcus sp. KNUC1210 TaxID=2917691 RepID=UPI001EF05869|nr:hypothetical protein [Deinococcus sp. KNUC1210]ULH14592.1 hypothetical protein MF271_11260 [Deinococcus sp. KNUC1210]
MTRRAQPDDDDAVQHAIRQIEEAKARRAADGEAPVSKSRGRPPGSGAKQQASAAPDEERSAAFSVSQTTAHTPLGLIEVQESSDLDALLADKTLAPLIALRLDERFALVLPGSAEKLLTALRKAGHTPRVEDRA